VTIAPAATLRKPHAVHRSILAVHIMTEEEKTYLAEESSYIWNNDKVPASGSSSVAKGLLELLRAGKGSGVYSGTGRIFGDDANTRVALFNTFLEYFRTNPTAIADRVAFRLLYWFVRPASQGKRDKSESATKSATELLAQKQISDSEKAVQTIVELILQFEKTPDLKLDGALADRKALVEFCSTPFATKPLPLAPYATTSPAIWERIFFWWDKKRADEQLAKQPAKLVFIGDFRFLAMWCPRGTYLVFALVLGSFVLPLILIAIAGWYYPDSISGALNPIKFAWMLCATVPLALYFSSHLSCVVSDSEFQKSPNLVENSLDGLDKYYFRVAIVPWIIVSALAIVIKIVANATDTPNANLYGLGCAIVSAVIVWKIFSSLYSDASVLKQFEELSSSPDQSPAGILIQGLAKREKRREIAWIVFVFLLLLIILCWQLYFFLPERAQNGQIEDGTPLLVVVLPVGIVALYLWAAWSSFDRTRVNANPAWNRVLGVLSWLMMNIGWALVLGFGASDKMRGFPSLKDFEQTCLVGFMGAVPLVSLSAWVVWNKNASIALALCAFLWWSVAFWIPLPRDARDYSVLFWVAALLASVSLFWGLHWRLSLKNRGSASGTLCDRALCTIIVCLLVSPMLWVFAFGWLNSAAITFTSPSSTIFTFGTKGTFTVKAKSTPEPSFAQVGKYMPKGIEFNQATGVLSGMPQETGIFPLVFKATNGARQQAEQVFKLTINQAPKITGEDGAK
jgi:hypothetical protein